MKIIQKNWSLIILFVSTLAIGSALIAEKIFDILPCKMCLYQRYPYYLIILISLIFIFSKKISLTFYYWIVSFLFAIGLFFSAWHVSIEQKILPGLSSCTNTIKISKSTSISDLKEQIFNQNIVTCDEITWSFMGLSAATLNSLLLIILLTINTVLLVQYRNDKEKKI